MRNRSEFLESKNAFKVNNPDRHTPNRTVDSVKFAEPNIPTDI